MISINPNPRLLHKSLIIALMLVFALIYLRFQGRVWWCECQTFKPISLNVNSMHNSQHLLDAYSLSHMLHGVLFFGLFWLFRNRMPLGWRLIAALAIEVVWEMMENSPIIINRYRAATVSLGYSGDSIVNSIGDIISFAGGFYVAARLRWWQSVILFLVIEGAMLWLIRDNLALNVLMLLWPIDAIRQWQADG